MPNGGRSLHLRFHLISLRKLQNLDSSELQNVAIDLPEGLARQISALS